MSPVYLEPGRPPRAILVALFAAAISTSAAATPPSNVARETGLVRAANASATWPSAPSLLEKAEREGRIWVVAGLRMATRPEHTLSPAELDQQRQAQGLIEDALLARVLDGDAQADVTRYGVIPFLALNVNAAELARLVSDPQIGSVEESTLLSPMLAESIPLVHADDVWGEKAGGGAVSGKGAVVAIIDSGFAYKTHPMLKKQVVSEACYSQNKPPAQESLCPGSATQSTAPGSALNCNVDGCDHGTHVASIAAGDAGGGKGKRGVAFGAKIIAIKAATKLKSKKDCEPLSVPCAKASSKDLLLALKRVYELRNKFDIAAVNISQGFGVHGKFCDNEKQFQAFTRIIRDLHGAGIATVAAAGNDGSDNGVGFPACISSAVAVGATARPDKKNREQVLEESNYGKLVDLMAPGDEIISAQPPNKYTPETGTSAAAPFVTGAFALLHQAVPKASPDDILFALQCSGKIVERPAGHGRPKPRIDLINAFNYLAQPKGATRSWDFSKESDALDWSPFKGDWDAKKGSYSPSDVYSDIEMISSTANCDRNVEIRARMKRTHPAVPDDVLAFPLTGFFFKAELDYLKRTKVGYLFAYGYNNQSSEGFVWVLRDDDGDGQFLCTEQGPQIPVNDNGYNELRVESRGAANKFFLNGTPVCASAKADGTYPYGAVALFGEFKQDIPSFEGTLEVDSVSITSLEKE